MCNRVGFPMRMLLSRRREYGTRANGQLSSITTPLNVEISVPNEIPLAPCCSCVGTIVQYVLFTIIVDAAVSPRIRMRGDSLNATPKSLIALRDTE